ncbi:MAG TPA: response regulator transcription factor [Thermodesulfobacteriota bacterium]|nr:response regulator transcription factor [Thermodesulfobacteriota bacterium]
MKTLLVDDHPLFLDGLKNLLNLRGIEVVGTARDGMEALEKARTLHPEIILMDIQMPNLDGLAATRLIKAELPDVKIVMLTMSAEDEDLFEAIKNGACGYLLKTLDVDEFFSLFLGLARGEVPLSTGLASRVLEEFARQALESKSIKSVEAKTEALSARQIQVLTLVAQGLTYKEVGAKLCLAERTIKYHIGEIIERLHVENRSQAIQYARGMKLVK